MRFKITREHAKVCALATVFNFKCCNDKESFTCFTTRKNKTLCCFRSLSANEITWSECGTSAVSSVSKMCFTAFYSRPVISGSFQQVETKGNATHSRMHKEGTNIVTQEQDMFMESFKLSVNLQKCFDSLYTTAAFEKWDEGQQQHFFQRMVKWLYLK